MRNTYVHIQGVLENGKLSSWKNDRILIFTEFVFPFVDCEIFIYEFV